MLRYLMFGLLTAALLTSCWETEEAEIKRLSAALSAADSQGALNRTSHELSLGMERKLKKFEGRIEKGLEGKELELFKKSAEAWQVYFESEWQFEAEGFHGGSIQPMMANSAATRLLAERIQGLEEWDKLGRFKAK
jgi:uncharacterized protein YecT (DUF1311 family)